MITNALYQTNDDDTQRPLTAAEGQEENARRWQIEQLHRQLKQLTGSQKCQCRKARSQRNHLACCYFAWLTLKVRAAQLSTSLYQVRANLFSDFLRSQLRNPDLPAYGRTLAKALTFLNHLVAHWQQGELYLIMDNLSLHKSLDVRLWA